MYVKYKHRPQSCIDITHEWITDITNLIPECRPQMHFHYFSLTKYFIFVAIVAINPLDLLLLPPMIL